LETKILKCDCGCGETANSEHERLNWLFLDQPAKSEDSYEPKLERQFHFKGIPCLNRWAQMADLKSKHLSKSAQNGPTPRGTYIDDTLPGVYV